MHIKIRVVPTVLIVAVLSLGCIAAENQTPPAGAKASEKSTTPLSSTKVSEQKTETAALTRVTGIGGVFIKAKDPKALRAWYKTHLGIDVQSWGGAALRWGDSSTDPANAKTAWYIGNGSTFAPSESPFMINYRVADLRALLKVLREEGCQVLDKIEESDGGIFGWVMDPEGNKVELWQPPKGK